MQEHNRPGRILTFNKRSRPPIGLIWSGASATRISVGTGKYSLNAMLNFVDVVHSLGRYVSVQEYNFNGDYGLAGYYLISSGLDALGNDAITPFNWWNGYDYDLGAPLGPRYNWLGVYRRDFSNG